MTGTRSVHELMSFENPVLGSYILWSAALALKTALMSMLPTVQPLLTKVIIYYIFMHYYIIIYASMEQVS